LLSTCQIRGWPRQQKKRRLTEEKQFRDSFNQLLKTQVEFADQYNSDHKIDVQKGEGDEEGLERAGKSDPWFGKEKTR